MFSFLQKSQKSKKTTKKQTIEKAEASSVSFAEKKAEILKGSQSMRTDLMLTFDFPDPEIHTDIQELTGTRKEYFLHVSEFSFGEDDRDYSAPDMITPADCMPSRLKLVQDAMQEKYFESAPRIENISNI